MIYASNGKNQGFFSTKTGKFVPVTKQYFKKWKKGSVKWWHTFGVVENRLGVDHVHLSSTRAWLSGLTPEQHFEECREDYREFVQEHPNNLVTVFHFMGEPHHPELSEESICRMIDILEGVYDVNN